MASEFEHARAYLKQMIGEDKEFRDGQWEAIKAVVYERKKVVVVQRTGWGKSIVYFLSTKLLREQGYGPTLLISPLLSLMRNQIQVAEKIGIRACSINSTNVKEWQNITESIIANQYDVILISPERLENKKFKTEVLQPISQKTGLLVVDEVHCISDWGHSFRTEYRRISKILEMLPKGFPVIGTTATANNRVLEDIKEQFGADIAVLRGPLVRTSLRLFRLNLKSQAERLAWLAKNIPNLEGNGIVYCSTRHDTQKVAAWLKVNGISVEGYVGGVEDAEGLEQSLIENKVKVLVATNALGMGFDKPDIGFVIHFQKPASVIAYYQQIGRAGRAIEKAFGILLNGQEDDEISEYFINTAFPPEKVMTAVLRAIEENESLTTSQIQKYVNASPTLIKKAVELLELDGAIEKEGSNFFRTVNQWSPDTDRIQRVLDQRIEELHQMQEYSQYEGCLMEFLERALDDPSPKKCGKCENCLGKKGSLQIDEDFLARAQFYLNNLEINIEPRKKFSNFKNIETQYQVNPGKALCYYGDAGYGELVHQGKYIDNCFNDELINASAELIQKRWVFLEGKPEWITAIPSSRKPKLVYDLAEQLSIKLNVPFIPVFERIKDVPPQKAMENSMQQELNVQNSLHLIAPPQQGSVLLVDDIIDSRWTMTVAGILLREHGSGPVYPFGLACAFKG